MSALVNKQVIKKANKPIHVYNYKAVMEDIVDIPLLYFQFQCYSKTNIHICNSNNGTVNGTMIVRIIITKNSIAPLISQKPTDQYSN